MRKNYEKAAFKSKPTSIRYNLAQFEIAKQLGGFGTVQQMFDVLLGEYVRLTTERVKAIDHTAKYPLTVEESILESPPALKPVKAAKPSAATKNEPTPRGSYDRRKQKLGW